MLPLIFPFPFPLALPLPIESDDPFSTLPCVECSSSNLFLVTIFTDWGGWTPKGLGVECLEYLYESCQVWSCWIDHDEGDKHGDILLGHLPCTYITCYQSKVLTRGARLWGESIVSSRTPLEYVANATIHANRKREWFVRSEVCDPKQVPCRNARAPAKEGPKVLKAAQFSNLFNFGIPDIARITDVRSHKNSTLVFPKYAVAVIFSHHDTSPPSYR